MDQWWVFVLLIVALVGLAVLRFVLHRRMMHRALEEAGRPGSRSRTMIVVAFLFVIAGTALLKMTDSWWWALLWVPGIVIALVVRRGNQSAQPQVDGAGNDHVH